MITGQGQSKHKSEGFLRTTEVFALHEPSQGQDRLSTLMSPTHSRTLHTLRHQCSCRERQRQDGQLAADLYAWRPGHPEDP